MFNYDPGTSATLTELQRLNKRLAELMPRLHDANQAFADAARPLKGLSDLDSDQKRELGFHLRAAEQACEEVTQQIDQVLARVGQLTDGVSRAPGGNAAS